jgi:hypothetical protein
MIEIFDNLNNDQGADCAGNNREALSTSAHTLGNIEKLDFCPFALYNNSVVTYHQRDWMCAG